MKRHPVKSSNIVSIGYNRNRNILEIEFDGGSVYQYEDVPAALHEALMSPDTESKGRFFDLHIKKGGYRFTKMPQKADKKNGKSTATQSA